MKWADLGVRCLDSPDARTTSYDASNTKFITDRFVPLDWTSAKGPARGLATVGVKEVAALIGTLKFTLRCCFEALHAYETIGSKERQRELLLESSRTAGCASLLWRLAMVCKPGLWNKHVIAPANANDASVRRTLEREMQKLFEPAPLKLAAGMRNLLMIRARQLSQLFPTVVSRLWSERATAMPLHSMAADIRYVPPAHTAAKCGIKDVNGHGTLSKDLLNVILRLDADRHINLNWNKWYYGQGVFGGEVALNLIKYGQNGHVRVKDKTVTALMLLTPEYRLALSHEAMVTAGERISRFFQRNWTTWWKLDIHTERIMLRLLGVADHALVRTFLDNLRCGRSAAFEKQALTQSSFLAFAMCNELHTQMLRLPRQMVQLVKSFL